MRPTLAVAFVALVACAAVADAISTEGFRPGKKHTVLSHHATHAKTHRHTSLHDLEEDVVNAAAATQDDDLVAKMDQSINSVMSDIDALKNDLQGMRSMEESIKQSLSASKAKADVPAAEEKSAETKDEAKDETSNTPASVDDVAPNTSSETDSFSSSDDLVSASADDSYADVDSFLQLQMKVPVDEMNDGLDDDSASAPSMIADRMMPHKAAQNKADEGKLFGLKGDGSRQTFDITPDGTEVYYPPPATLPGTVPSNDAASRMSGDSSLDNVPVPKFDRDSVVTDARMPGTFGKALSLSATGNTTSDDDMVCLCKRRGAPRGNDRVRCKKHPSASPSPSPKPIRTINIVQCEHGVWPQGSGADSGTVDTICIYFPGRTPVETPVPTPTPSPDLPDECYDERNEFVADEILERRRVHRNLLDEALIQSGAEICGCD